MKKIITCVFVLLSTNFYGYSQDTVLNKYGLFVIDNLTSYKKTVQVDSINKMVDVKKWVPDIVVELKYAKIDNFMHGILYESTNTTYLRLTAAMALAKVQQQLRHHNVGLKIWDAYRPYSVTEKMWEPLKDERYVANPKYGSGHNRGVAVDLTLVDVTTGKELDMGTGFDHFSDTAHVSFKALPANVLANRALLQQHMEAAGFVVLETEWWHFYLPDTRKYALLNLTFRQLKKINRSQQIH